MHRDDWINDLPVMYRDDWINDLPVVYRDDWINDLPVVYGDDWINDLLVVYRDDWINDLPVVYRDDWINLFVLHATSPVQDFSGYSEGLKSDPLISLISALRGAAHPRRVVVELDPHHFGSSLLFPYNHLWKLQNKKIIKVF